MAKPRVGDVIDELCSNCTYEGLIVERDGDDWFLRCPDCDFEQDWEPEG